MGVDEAGEQQAAGDVDDASLLVGQSTVTDGDDPVPFDDHARLRPTVPMTVEDPATGEQSALHTAPLWTA